MISKDMPDDKRKLIEDCFKSFEDQIRKIIRSS